MAGLEELADEGITFVAFDGFGQPCEGVARDAVECKVVKSQTRVEAVLGLASPVAPVFDQRRANAPGDAGYQRAESSRRG